MGHKQQTFLRYRVIDACLQQRNKIWTYENLAEACNDALYELEGDRDGFSRATLMRDIRIMRAEPPLGYGAPIRWDRQRKTYYYADPSFSINKSPLSENDLRYLQKSLYLLQQMPHLVDAVPWQQLSTQLKQLLRLENNNSTIVQFEASPKTTALHWLSPLYESIDQKKSIQMRYKPFTEVAQQVTISPWLLKQYNRRWFLIAWSKELQQVRTFALDRIEKISPAPKQSWFIQHDFSPEQRYQNVVGLSIPEGASPQKIQLKTSPLRANYIRTKPIHASQKETQRTESYSIFELVLILNVEFEQKILSFGAEVEVLQPETLRTTIQQTLQKAFQQYDD